MGRRNGHGLPRLGCWVSKAREEVGLLGAQGGYLAHQPSFRATEFSIRLLHFYPHSLPHFFLLGRRPFSFRSAIKFLKIILSVMTHGRNFFNLQTPTANVENSFFAKFEGKIAMVLTQVGKWFGSWS